MLQHGHQRGRQIDQSRVCDDASVSEIAQEVKYQPLVPWSHHHYLVLGPTQLDVPLGEPDAEIDLEELQYPVRQVFVRLSTTFETRLLTFLRRRSESNNKALVSLGLY